MRKLFLTAISSILFTGSCFASYPFDPLDVHVPNLVVTEGVYISSNIPGAPTQVVISTTSSSLHTITVNSAGTSSFAEVYNGNQSSSTFKNKIAKIDTTGKISLIYDVYCSSGIVVYNYGSTPADITINYLFKR